MFARPHTPRKASRRACACASGDVRIPCGVDEPPCASFGSTRPAQSRAGAAAAGDLRRRSIASGEIGLPLAIGGVVVNPGDLVVGDQDGLVVVAREAFGELERAGLIERRRNRGASVRSLTPDDVNQIYAVREILERAAAAQIPLPLDRRQLAAIEAAQRRHDEAIAAGDAKAVFRTNFEFHDALFAACGNPYLARAIDDFRKKTHVVWSYAIVKPEYFRNAQREHRAMIKALKDRDRKRLVELCAAHLDISRAAYLETWRLRFRA